MDFKNYLIEEEKKVEKLVVCFVKDVDEKEVYTVLSSKAAVNNVLEQNKERYSFLAPSEAIKLVSKGYSPKLFDFAGLKKHVESELKSAEEK